MLLLILITLSALVAIIGLVTARLNVKVPCQHHWVEYGNNLKCSKCFRMINQEPVYPDSLDENSFLDITDNEEFSLADAELD
jgi:hypothetical protein